MKFVSLSAITVFVLLQFASYTGDAQTKYTIWPGKAPGSENWQWQEATDSVSLLGDPLIYNVVQPTLTYYPADPTVANGTSIIICPGGSFCYLHIKTEGSDVAAWLNKKGVAVFILKYRLVHSESNKPMQERMERGKDTVAFMNLAMDAAMLAISDAKQSIAFVRSNAKELKLSPEKIGIMGFSAGGTLAAASLTNYTVANKPNFVVPVYAFIPPVLSIQPAADAPPLFIVAASDDELQLVPMSVNLYSQWLAAKKSAELHIYSKGGHGFGMNKLNLPSDTWIERFGDWLHVNNLLNK